MGGESQSRFYWLSIPPIPHAFIYKKTMTADRSRLNYSELRTPKPTRQLAGSGVTQAKPPYAMAYRRAYRRKPTNKGRKTRRLSKHMVRAIKAISQIPAETKHYPAYASISAFLLGAGYISGQQATIRSNILADIPRANNTSSHEEYSFTGDSLNLRGLRFQINMYTISSTPGVIQDAQFRFTVFSDNEFFSGTTGPGPTNRIFDQAVDTTATWAMWNPQVVKIHYQRRFKMNNDGNTNSMVMRKFYVPLRRKITTQQDTSIVTNNYMGEVMGKQVYWALEFLAPGVSNLSSFLTGSISTKVYFKDE